jgi:hypothetical protein
MSPASPAFAEDTVFAGSMREMRVRASDEQTLPPQPSEVLDLRNKIVSQLAPREQPAAAIATPPRPAGFAGLLGGAPRPVEPPQIRRLADPIREKACRQRQLARHHRLAQRTGPPTWNHAIFPSARETWSARHRNSSQLEAAQVPHGRALAEPTMLAGKGRGGSAAWRASR